ncbi:MAG: bile acid:sodium symporter family protein [Candidatus Nanohaloarchaea archaeon]
MKHGIKLDLEFLAIVLGAGILAYFITGNLVSNALFTALISLLFFLMGLHLDIDELKKCGQHQKEVATGMAMVYIFTPLLAFMLFTITGGPLGDAFIAIGVSAAAIGSPVVFSNLSKGEGSLALMTAGISLLAGFVVIPLLLLGFGATLPVQDIAVNNLVFMAVPLLTGIFAQRFENVILEDMRHHFSKVGLWLLVLVMLVQFRIVYQSEGLSFLGQASGAVFLMAGFVMASYAVAHLVSRFLKFSEPQSRAIGFVASSKSLAISLFIASQISGAAVAYVSMYYFVRQAVTGGIMELHRHDELRSLKRFFSRVEGWLTG